MAKSETDAFKPGKPASKSEIVKKACEDSGLVKKDVIAVLDSLGKQIEASISSTGPGIFKLLGLLQVKKVYKAAQPARKGIDPFSKTEKEYPAKPASYKVKVLPMKALKDVVK